MSKIEFHEITLDDKTWMGISEDDGNACECIVCQFCLADGVSRS